MLTEAQLRNPDLFNRIVSADEAASHITDGMTVGVSGFTPSGYPKAITLALAEQVRAGRQCRINLTSGASVGPEIEEALAAVGAVARRFPYDARGNKSMRKGVNDGSIVNWDMHLSHTAPYLNYGFLGDVDVAIVEAIAINPDGGLVLSSGVGNTPMQVMLAKVVMVELNTAQPAFLEGVHDIYIQPKPWEGREAIGIYQASDRIGTTCVPCPLDKIKFIVETDIPDHPVPLTTPDEPSIAIAHHIAELFDAEVKARRLPENLLPLQSGVGSIANAVFTGLIDSHYHDLVMYSEILQDAVFELINVDKIKFASGCAYTPSARVKELILADPDKYMSKIILRPLDISNHPEVIRRLGCIALNTALEFDIDGQENSTHASGTDMMNGIGGSGDYMRNAYLSIFATNSTAKNGEISRIVPMVSHVDNTEHDVDIFVTEHGIADIRGLGPRERSRAIINNCAHPDFRDQLMDSVLRAEAKGGHQPQLLDEALSWHVRAEREGTMRV